MSPAKTDILNKIMIIKNHIRLIARDKTKSLKERITKMLAKEAEIKELRNEFKNLE